MSGNVTSQTQDSQSPRPSISAAVEACTEAVERYRSDGISRLEAVVSIADQLNRPEVKSGAGDVDTALRSYLNMLDEVDRERGEHRSPRERSRTKRRGREPTRSPEPDESRATSPESDSPRSKRAKPDQGQYAWAATEFLMEDRLRPEVRQTLDLIKVYVEDLKQAKRDLTAAASAPEFPDAEWNNILTGRAVDLDHVFAGCYTTSTEDRVTERLGDLEIKYRAPVPAKRIHNFGDWVFAWSRTTKAICFAFPHRNEELTAYGAHIVSLFGALAEPLHARVLEYAKAVRKRVGSARRFLLTNLVEFVDLKMQYIDSGGANRDKEACRLWNRGQCPRKASECRFRHACLLCGAEGHGVGRCDQAAKRSN
ncbi:hypothetical protein OH77DRAFT_1498170 [Trametes cingulata]|nr:hypothetical protein OH77DRAFT_1498170 [Trametes cingulata]